jgi:hypothetical protein
MATINLPGVALVTGASKETNFGRQRIVAMLRI